MNLIIVSQDKENIVKFNSNIGLHYRDKKKIVANYIDLGYGDYYELLGEYETKERALEVLNEIESLFIKREQLETIFTKDGLKVISTPITSIVYEMPEE